MDMEKDKYNEVLDDFKNYEPRLNQEWVQVLINLRMKYSKAFTRKRNSAAEAWRNILMEMIELGAPPYITLEKIKKKWMNLIARYKHLKFSTNSETITWPYFEQIDRAYTRNPNIVEIKKTPLKKDSDSDSVSDYAEQMMRKQQFTAELINLRHAHRHLFTGKKYAAQKGWMVIQNLLPNGQAYTIDQISKCWQNVLQRYKGLLESEDDHSKITWVHFQSMHGMMTKKDEPTAMVEVKEELEAEESLINVNNCLEINYQLTPKQKKRRTTNLTDLLEYFKSRDENLLTYMKERDETVDVQHKELMDGISKIAELIKK